MPDKIKVKNSVVAGNRPATGTGTPGELWTNIPDKAFGTFDAAGAPLDLVFNIRISTADPTVADLASQNTLWIKV